MRHTTGTGDPTAGEPVAPMPVALGAGVEEAYATSGPGTHAPDEGSTGPGHGDTAFRRITGE